MMRLHLREYALLAIACPCMAIGCGETSSPTANAAGSGAQQPRETTGGSTSSGGSRGGGDPGGSGGTAEVGSTGGSDGPGSSGESSAAGGTGASGGSAAGGGTPAVGGGGVGGSPGSGGAPLGGAAGSRPSGSAGAAASPGEGGSSGTEGSGGGGGTGGQAGAPSGGTAGAVSEGLGGSPSGGAAGDTTQGTGGASGGPPDIVFPGGTIDDLRALSPTLEFGDLTIAGELYLNPGEDVALVVESLTVDARIWPGHDFYDCIYLPGPSLSITATGAVLINAAIDLGGDHGNTESVLNPGCEECWGTDGGDLEISADTIGVYGGLLTWGGASSMRVIQESPLEYGGCDGPDGGDLKLTATSAIDIGYGGALYITEGRGGQGSNGDPALRGADGQPGALDVSAPSITAVEVEGNGYAPPGSQFPYTPMVISGSTGVNDDSPVATAGVVYYDTDFIEDIYEIVVPTDQTITVMLEGPSDADLDLLLADQDINFLAVDGNATASEMVSAAVTAGHYYVLVSYRSSVADSVGYTLTFL